MEQLKNRKKLFDGNDVIPLHRVRESLQGKILVLYAETLHKDFQTPKHQLFVAQSGFGTEPGTLGSAIDGYYLVDGIEFGFHRNDFIGVLKNEIVDDYGLYEK